MATRRSLCNNATKNSPKGQPSGSFWDWMDLLPQQLMSSGNELITPQINFGPEVIIGEAIARHDL